MTLTLNQLKKILPLNKDVTELCDLLNKYLPLYEINTKDRIVMFMSQCSHESNQFTVMKENLNYSSQGLLKTFSKYFNEKQAEQYARKPEMIANRAYANRMGNSNEASGDGWTFRGKGYIMLTGRSNVTAFATYIKKSVDETSKYLETKEGALCGGMFWWKENQLNSFSDAQDIIGATKRINDGTNGIVSRQDEYKRISAII